MKNQTRLSATQAAREFSRLLDRVARGAEFVIERRSQPLARIGPAWQIPRKISACIALPVSGKSATADPDFGRDLLAIIEASAAEGPPPWE